MSGSRRLVLGVMAGLLMAGCATRPTPAPANPAASAAQGPWAGRVSLRLDAAPPSLTTGSFELSGSMAAGELRLSSPLGQLVARLSWTPQQATLDQGAGRTSTYPSLDALLTQALGTPVPAAALFDWLAGVPTSAAGWTPDLSRRADGRITAVRQTPAPRAELRLIIDTP